MGDIGQTEIKINSELSQAVGRLGEEIGRLDPANPSMIVIYSSETPAEEAEGKKALAKLLYGAIEGEWGSVAGDGKGNDFNSMVSLSTERLCALGLEIKPDRKATLLHLERHEGRKITWSDSLLIERVEK